MVISSYDSIEDGIRGCFGEDVKITGKSFVSGGDINDAFCLHLSDGTDVFVKSNSIENMDFFKAEVKGINAISSTGTIGTPRLICMGIDHSANSAFLMMEMILRTPMVKGFFSVFGRELAKMHMADTKEFVPDGKFGFISDNYIGASKQKNAPKDNWLDFFRECRLKPQFEMADRYFDHSQIKQINILIDKLDRILTEPPIPSLLHGDLWSGNFITGRDGRAWLIDPAVYVGHAEADLAMTELFGRLPEEFYKEYMSINPIQPGYRDRKDLYNLYHLLNHLNLFGSSYLPSVLGTVKRYSG